jgi:hypothetical protein
MRLPLSVLLLAVARAGFGEKEGNEDDLQDQQNDEAIRANLDDPVLAVALDDPLRWEEGEEDKFVVLANWFRGSTMANAITGGQKGWHFQAAAEKLRKVSERFHCWRLAQRFTICHATRNLQGRAIAVAFVGGSVTCGAGGGMPGPFPGMHGFAASGFAAGRSPKLLYLSQVYTIHCLALDSL